MKRIPLPKPNVTLPILPLPAQRKAYPFQQAPKCHVVADLAVADNHVVPHSQSIWRCGPSLFVTRGVEATLSASTFSAFPCRWGFGIVIQSRAAVTRVGSSFLVVSQVMAGSGVALKFFESRDFPSNFIFLTSGLRQLSNILRSPPGFICTICFFQTFCRFPFHIFVLFPVYP